MSGNLHSVAQVAAKLGLRRHAVLALIRAGELRAVDVSLRLGGRPHWKILAEDIDQFIEKRTFHVSPPRVRRRRRKLETKQYF